VRTYPAQEHAVSAPRVRRRAQVEADIAALPAAHSVSSQGEAADEIMRLRDEAKVVDIEVRARSSGVCRAWS